MIGSIAHHLINRVSSLRVVFGLLKSRHELLSYETEAGNYTLRVSAPSVPGTGEPDTDRQGFALVATAGHFRVTPGTPVRPRLD